MGILKTIAEAFHEGGFGMWPILVSLIFIIAITVERAVFLFKASVDKDKLLALLKSQVMNGNVQGAVQVCSSNPTPITRIVQAGLSKFNRSDADVQAAMDESALRELPKVNARTPYLAMLSNFAVMAGLFGTIVGMIKSFGAAAGADASSKAAELANGISEALNCTGFGILVSLVGLLAFSLLTGKTTKVTDDINEVTVQVVNLVTSHRTHMQQPTA
ncbi:MotA/TolQ/ExbB proton channel family protein [Haliangium ochraceum]|uniref:MotA/TolQ/ExbB proton channel n=1 Tax=Haliangium ochraceum (strain DSM 14365 / JCM 11303 / SMP-2) TaxID=502025 RepID=D0LY02_HALO1|nr:MotA/TolQ/ExbB proton channel family protein [Haliangium ochraceum]ACY14357.1 MotA/TolQ/ExbB proton channel [Haliangium ochraceum DSM 14365]